MAEGQYAFVVWAGTQQKSVIKCTAITSGTATPNQEVTAQWWGGVMQLQCFESVSLRHFWLAVRVIV